MPLVAYTKPISGIDSSYKLRKIIQNAHQYTYSSGTKFYQKTLSQTLSSSCDFFPHDSKYNQILMKKCPKINAILKSMARFYQEPDAATLKLDTVIKGKIKYVDLPQDCNLL